MKAYDNILALLNKKGIEYEIFEHEPLLSSEVGVKALPFDEQKLVKTLAFIVNGSALVLVAARLRDRLDYPKLSASINVPRNKIQQLGAEEIEKNLGFEIGGIGPFQTDENVMLLIDRKVLDFRSICCGMGKNGSTLEISVKSLLTIGNPVVCDVTK